MTMDFRKARDRMVEEQIIARGIRDPKVTAALRRVPRHLFVGEGFRERAYGDYPLPIGEGQTISQPYMVAMMTNALGLLGHEKVLEIGTCSGYQTAVLAEIVPRIFSIERIPTLARRARRMLDSLGYQNVVIKTFDGTYGWEDESPFDAILVTAGAPSLPEMLPVQLAEGGRLVIPMGTVVTQSLCRLTREGDRFVRDDLGSCVFVKLVGRYGWEGTAKE
jgi:protein-L-isoaspartate(D-aspartate) O-methyltransferase